jgi:hypothetical protein
VQMQVPQALTQVKQMVVQAMTPLKMLSLKK